MITIFTDASHCPNTNAAGWGAWAKRDGWPQGIVIGGPIRTEVLNSGEAEIAAMANALSRLVKEDLLPVGQTIMLQADSHRALQVVAGAIPEAKVHQHADSVPWTGTAICLSPLEKRAAAVIKEMTAGRTIYLRHVKGHRGGGGRNWVNRTCDQIAKTHMRKQRAQRK